MNTSDLTDPLIRRMSPAARAQLGVQTSDEASTKFVAKSERELQNQICNLLRQRGIWFDQDAMHKRRTGTKSAPDFQFPLCGRFVAWEVKHNGGKLDAGQERTRDKIINQGGEWRLITNLEAARAHLDAITATYIG